MVFCSSAPLWLGQSIAVHHRGEKIQRISDSSSPIPNSEEPSGQRLSSSPVGLPADGVEGPRIIGRELDLARWIS